MVAIVSAMQMRCESRVPTEIQGRYRYGRGLAKDVVVTDLSTRGCKFFDKFCNLSPGTSISLRIGSIGPLNAKVRWTKNRVVGVQFEQALHPSVLDHLCTTIPDWQPAPARPTASIHRIAPPPVRSARSEAITVRIRPPTTIDAMDAISALQMRLPLRSESEVVAVFHEMLNRVFVAPAHENPHQRLA